MFTPPPPSSRHEPCSFDAIVHYSFDMAQQVHYPSDPLQPGPIYFLTPRKCGIFGVCCEAVPRQINYLIDEARDTGKGSNIIVSMLHHFFQVHGLGETNVHLHADNCVGQNKNNTMLHYLIWRVMVGLHKRIVMSFLILGHTKFSPDWCFGLLKQRFCRTKVGCLADLERVVNESAEANVAQLVGTQSSQPVVPIYNWTTLFSGHLRKLKNIKQYHHLTIDVATPGSVNLKLESDTQEDHISLLLDSSWAPSAEELPSPITPSGLSLEQQWYLHNQIAQYCPEDVREIVCPKPSTPLPSTTPAAAALQESPAGISRSDSAAPVVKNLPPCEVCASVQ